MKKYIIICYQTEDISGVFMRALFFEKLTQYSIKYIDEQIRIMLPIPRVDHVTYKLNETKARYELIKDQKTAYTLSIYKGNVMLFFPLQEYPIFTHTFKPKHFIQVTKIFKEPVQQAINNLVILSKITQTQTTIRIENNEIIIGTDLSLEGIKKIFANNVFEIANNPNTARTSATIKTKLPHIYDFEYIDNKFSISLKSIEKLKQDTDLSKIKIDIKKTQETSKEYPRFPYILHLSNTAQNHNFYIPIEGRNFGIKKQVSRDELKKYIDLIDLDAMKSIYYAQFYTEF